jgi:MFS superfamily sulfate permease-like transporter
MFRVGMAGHVAFGARIGGSLVILGGLLLVLAICFSASVVALFELIPQAVRGTILFMTGRQLAGGRSTKAARAMSRRCCS